MPDLTVNMLDTQNSFSISVAPGPDEDGDAGAFNGPVSVVSQDLTKFTITDNPDGTFTAMRVEDTTGTTTIVVSDTVINQNIVVTVAGGLAQSLDVTLGPPV